MIDYEFNLPRDAQSREAFLYWYDTVGLTEQTAREKSGYTGPKVVESKGLPYND